MYLFCACVLPLRKMGIHQFGKQLKLNFGCRGFATGF